MSQRTLGLMMVTLLVGLLLGACVSEPDVEPTATPEPEPLTASTPEESVQAFFEFWMDYSTPDANGNFRNPMVDEIYKDSPYLTPELKETIEETLLSMGPGGYDPVMCAQDTPQWINVKEVETEGEQASALVETSMMAGPQAYHTVPVNLEKRGEVWLITGIDCEAALNMNVAGASGPEPVAPQPAAEGDWAVYRDEQYGFSFDYPSSWFLQEASIVGQDVPVDRVITLAPGDGAGAITPVSVEMSTGQTGEVPHTETLEVNGLIVMVEQTPYEETLYTVELPGGVRVTIRDTSMMASGGDEDLLSQWTPVIEAIVHSFSFG